MMRLKRLLPAFMAVVMLMPTTAYAAKKDEVATLTVAEATKKAVSNSEAIWQAYASEALSEESEAVIRESVFNATTVEAKLTNEITLMKHEVNRALNMKSITAQKDNLEYSITKMFSSIITAEKNLAMYDEGLLLQKSNLDIAKTKLSLGLLSQVEYDKQKADYETSVNSRVSIETAIDNAYQTLNSLMGQKLDKKYTLELDMTWAKLGSVNVTTMKSKYINKSISVQQAEDNLQVAKQTLENHKANAASYNGTSFKSYDLMTKEYEQSVSSASRAVTDAKEEVEAAIRTALNSIRESETKYESMLIDLQQMYTNLKVMETQLALGQVTQLSLDEYAYSIKAAEEELRQHIYDHQIAVMQFNNPYLLT